MLSGFYSLAQMDNVYAKIEITSFHFHEQRPFIDTSIVIVLEKFGRSEIISLGTLDGTEVGFQLELLKSNLGEKVIMVNGKAFYTKKDGKWEMHSNPMYQSSEYKTISNKSQITDKDFGLASTTILKLQIDYKQQYYVIK